MKKGDRVGIWSPNCPEWVAVQYGTALIGAILVNINPGLPGVRAGVRAAPGGRRYPGQRHPAQDQRLPGHGRGGPAHACPALRDVIYIGEPSWAALEEAGRPGRAGTAVEAASAPPWPSTTPSTSSTPRERRASPRGPPFPTTTSSTTATSWPSSSATPKPTGCACPCPSITASAWSWATSGAPRTARPSSSRRRCSTRPPPWRRSPSERCTSLYGVPTMFIAELGRRRVRRLRPVVAAHRDHGRVALSGRGHEAGHHRDAHGGRGHRLRHDRDLAGVDPDPRRRRPRAAHRHRRAGSCPTWRSR